MLLSALAAVSFAPWAKAAGEASPCAVRAWVRADDLWPNSVSYGELKVKLSQPCEDTVRSVVLRLRLDESAEQAKLSNTTTSGEFWDWGGDVPSPEWTTTRHTRNTFKIERTVFPAGDAAAVQDWGDGREFQFSIHTPNVNYPPALHPLIFKRRNSDTENVAFSRAYRYSALVTLASPSGETRSVEVPAGFTAFQPVTPRSAIDSKPHEIVVEAVSKDAPWECPHKQTPSESCDKDEQKMLSVRVVMPNGPTAVQGQDFTVVVSLPNGEDRLDSATAYTRTARLEFDIRPSFAGSSTEPDGLSRNSRTHLRVSRFTFQEIHTRLWEAAVRKDRRTGCAGPLSSPLRVNVPETFPRTSAGNAPFIISAELVVSVTERAGAAHMNPLHDHNIECPAGGCAPPEDGWEFGACDNAQHSTRTYTSRIPITVVGRHVSDASPAADYLAADLAPCIAVPPDASCDFGEAAPVETQGSRNGPAPSSSGDPFYARRSRMESIDAKAGQYVGALWQSKMHRLETKLVPLVFPGEAGAGQLTMGQPRTT